MHAAGLCSSGGRSATCMQQCLSHAAPAEAAALHRQPHAHGRSGSGTVAAQGAPADSSSKTTAPFHARQTPDVPGRSGSGRAGRAWGSPGCLHRRCPAARPAQSCRCREQGMGSKGEAGVRQTLEREWGQAGRDVGAPAAAAAAGAAAHGSREAGFSLRFPHLRLTGSWTAGSRWWGPAGRRWRSPSPCGRAARRGGSGSCKRSVASSAQ